LSKKKKVIHYRWIFKTKEGLSSNQLSRFNGRLLVKVFGKIPGIDYNDVFSSVVEHGSIHEFFGIVSMNDLELEMLDVKPDFLHENFRYTWTKLKALVCLVRRIEFAS
jgi:hypothetical protein